MLLTRVLLKPTGTPLHKYLDALRMGSFTSAPKILNKDTQDSDVYVPAQTSRDEMLAECEKQLSHLPPLVRRSFQAVSASDRMAETPAGIRVLQWNVLSDVCDSVVNEPEHFRVLQWNVLSQTLGKYTDNFVCCPEDALNWKTRRFRILEEILVYSPDIICLQEVDHFNFLKMTLDSLGFSGHFFPKPDSPCMYIKGNNGPDGCAIFYNRTKFELVSIETRILEVWHVQSNQVVIMLMLHVKDTGRDVCVASTHLKARKGALLSTLRNEQGKDLCEFLKRTQNGKPVIICGDFNAEPSEPVYSTLLGDGDLSLASAYQKLNENGREPPYTTWKVRAEGEICHTIDYIFYTQRDFNVESLLKFPSGEELGVDRLPSFQYPSDHLSLVCDVKFKTQTAQI